MILVGQYDSPFVRRVEVTLNGYGITFERQARPALRPLRGADRIHAGGLYGSRSAKRLRG